MTDHSGWTMPLMVSMTTQSQANEMAAGHWRRIGHK